MSFRSTFRLYAPALLVFLVSFVVGCADDGGARSLEGLLSVDGESHAIDVPLDYVTSSGRYELSTSHHVHGVRIRIVTRQAKTLVPGSYAIGVGGAVEVSFDRDTSAGLESTLADTGTVVITQVPSDDRRRWQGELVNVRANFENDPQTVVVASDVMFTVDFSRDAYRNAQD